MSTQHERHVSEGDIRAYVQESLGPHALGRWFDPTSTFIVNPSGSFVEGGPSADWGVTGREIIADFYGGVGRHRGGAFSGEDPSKVDRSAAYFRRYVARALVQSVFFPRINGHFMQNAGGYFLKSIYHVLRV